MHALSISTPIPICHRRSGSTLTEAVIAAGLIGLLFSVIATTYSTSLGVLRGQRETIAANLLLQGRVEQLRAGGWAQLTDADGLRQNVLGYASPQAAALPNIHETITVTTYPPVSPAPTPLCVERNSDGSTAVVTQPGSGFSLRRVLAVRVDIHVDWKSKQNGRKRVRETSSVISLGGLLR